MEITVMWLKAFAFSPADLKFSSRSSSSQGECEVRLMWHYLSKIFVMEHEIPGILSGLASSAKILFCKQSMEYET